MISYLAQQMRGKWRIWWLRNTDKAAVKKNKEDQISCNWIQLNRMQNMWQEF